MVTCPCRREAVVSGALLRPRLPRLGVSAGAPLRAWRALSGVHGSPPSVIPRNGATFDARSRVARLFCSVRRNALAGDRILSTSETSLLASWGKLTVTRPEPLPSLPSSGNRDASEVVAHEQAGREWEHRVSCLPRDLALRQARFPIQSFGASSTRFSRAVPFAAPSC